MNPNLVHRSLTEDLSFFAQHAQMVVKDVQGNLVPFRFNRAQRYIHERLEEQRTKRGWVRALLLKGRQQGGSTYIQARFFHRVMRTPGQTAFILSHEGKTTDKLFDMVRRFYENMHPALRPARDKDNPRQMTFPGLNADYSAGTAGNEQVGRGGTAQLFHGSEAAYWDYAYEIQEGALKSIRLIAGTEIILESTANGPAGLFYDKCRMALRGEGDYILVFVPWFWEDDYEREDAGEDLTVEEERFVEDYFSKPFPYAQEPISRAKARRKMLWRRNEITDLAPSNPEAGAAKFRAVYPSNPIEAFLSTSVGIVRPDAIVSARRTAPMVDEFAARIGGCDPAGAGKKSDRTIIAIRQGRCLEKVLKWAKMKPMELAGIIAKLIDEENLDMMFVDRGYGEGTIDRLHELGYGRRIIGVAFNERPLNPIYMNKRSEILIEGANWINSSEVSIPDDDEIHADLAAMPLDKETSGGLKYMPPKEEIVKAFGRSYDIFDALALTFSYPVRRSASPAEANWRKAQPVRGAKSGPLSSMNRRREFGSR